VIDDVITAGTAIRESLGLITAANAELAAVCVSIDRQERGQQELSAIQEIQRDHNVEVVTIASLSSIIEYLANQSNRNNEVAAIKAYREQYGV